MNTIRDFTSRVVTGFAKNENVETRQSASASSQNSSDAVDAGVLNGKAIHLPEPNYPSIARSARASGSVSVLVTVDEAGKVITARAINGHPLLRGEAEIAARKARFSPVIISGEPVKVKGVIIYQFMPR